ncbi:hypothetical protein POF51_02815 [Brevibacillus sp. AG]|uniref:hypothetical protein n=1 Tax=Brevibacillus sp. AG TaxID=3020891 RepID=UPI000852DBC4|nr:hypothetical protein [Brevibacillus sp. AG]MDC0759615.1 hypothetical protein [Brevibacillus sp. AG]
MIKIRQVARASDAIYFPRSEAGARVCTEQQVAKVPDGDNMRLAIETLDGELVGTINSHHCDPRNGNFQYGLLKSEFVR